VTYRSARCYAALRNGLRGVTLQASIRRFQPSCPLAAPVLEIDTIPKPDGLGQAFEANTPKNIQTISNGIRDCSAAVRYAFARDDWKGMLCDEQAAIERADLTRSTFTAP